jgi:16S rRNA A1518/A1519 N6-dimethyltransferase RsmA/KsgA/DIM1 with predicted DNA glycosylase/AP lyase activity
MAAGPGSKTYGRLSVMLQVSCEITPLFDIGPESFDPPPMVAAGQDFMRSAENIPVRRDERKRYQVNGVRMISTRRFKARPSGVSFDAIGEFGPIPRVAIRCDRTSWVSR